jgi:hypothetical protein
LSHRQTFSLKEWRKREVTSEETLCDFRIPLMRESADRLLGAW